jgi:hypothetical protein
LPISARGRSARPTRPCCFALKASSTRIRKATRTNAFAQLDGGRTTFSQCRVLGRRTNGSEVRAGEIDYAPITATSPPRFRTIQVCPKDLRWQEGRHPHCHFRGLLRLHTRYGPPDRSAALGRPLSRGFGTCSCPHEPLVSYRINRQLSGWNLPPLMIRAFGAHCHMATYAVQQVLLAIAAARQAHCKHRTFARLARHDHIAAHHAGELAGDGKSEPGAAEALRGRLIGLDKLLE